MPTVKNSTENINTILNVMNSISKLGITSNTEKQLVKSVYNELKKISKYNSIRIVLFNKEKCIKIIESGKLSDKNLLKKLKKTKVNPQCIKHIEKHIDKSILVSYLEICKNCSIFTFNKKIQ